MTINHTKQEIIDFFEGILKHRAIPINTDFLNIAKDTLFYLNEDSNEKYEKIRRIVKEEELFYLFNKEFSK